MTILMRRTLILALLAGTAGTARADARTDLAHRYVDAIVAELGGADLTAATREAEALSVFSRPDFPVLRQGVRASSLTLSVEADGRFRIFGERAGRPYLYLDRAELESLIARRLAEGWGLPDASDGPRGDIESARALMQRGRQRYTDYVLGQVKEITGGRPRLTPNRGLVATIQDAVAVKAEHERTAAAARRTLAGDYAEVLVRELGNRDLLDTIRAASDIGSHNRPDVSFLRMGTRASSLQLSFEPDGRARIFGLREGNPYVYVEQAELPAQVEKLLAQGWGLPDAEHGPRGTLESASSLIGEARASYEDSVRRSVRDITGKKPAGSGPELVRAIEAAAALKVRREERAAAGRRRLAADYVELIYRELGGRPRSEMAERAAGFARPEISVLRMGVRNSSLQLSFEPDGERVRIFGLREGHPYIYMTRGELETMVEKKLGEGWDLPDAEHGPRGTLESARAMIVEERARFEPRTGGGARAARSEPEGGRAAAGKRRSPARVRRGRTGGAR